ncbi:hypothetical protein GQ600_7808 [Phytophthora cactorum]|nr:hypothetical protein GQ600_7808 [Phytophthora cactorum]
MATFKCNHDIQVTFVGEAQIHGAQVDLGHHPLFSGSATQSPKQEEKSSCSAAQNTRIETENQHQKRRLGGGTHRAAHHPRGLLRCGMALAPCRATCIIKLPPCNNPITTVTSTFNGSLQGMLLSGRIASIMVESGLALLTLKAGPVKLKRVGSTAKMTPVATKIAISKIPHAHQLLKPAPLPRLHDQRRTSASSNF